MECPSRRVDVYDHKQTDEYSQEHRGITVESLFQRLYEVPEEGALRPDTIKNMKEDGRIQQLVKGAMIVEVRAYGG